MTSKLQQEFLQLFRCIIDFGADVLRDCTKGKMKTNYQTDKFKIFLGKTKHNLFHQLPKQNPICCACPITGCSIRKTGYVERRIFDKFYSYDNTLPIPPGHHAANGKKNLQTCICRFVENNKVLDDLDLSDLNCLLRSLSLMTSLEEVLLKDLMEVRGTVCHAVTTKTFSNHELTNLWTTFMNSVCKLCPSDPKYLKKAIDLTKSSVLSDDKILELTEKVQQIITDCHEIKPVIMEYTEKFNAFENRQNEHNTRVETRLERLESLFMGHFKAKQASTQATISVYDSEKSNITDVTYSGKQGDRYIECEASCPDLDEDKALKRLATETYVNCSKKLKIESVEKHCILLKLSSRPELFESEEILHSAITSLVQKISDAGEIDTSVDSNMDIKITFTSPLTDDERNIIMSMLDTYGTINEGYTTKVAYEDESICDKDSKTLDYSDISGHDERQKVFPREELKIKPEKQFYAIKKEDMKYMPMDFLDKCSRTAVYKPKSLEIECRNIKSEATDKKYDEMFVRLGTMNCLWRIEGLPNRLQHLDGNQDISVDEGEEVWYLQWRMECPKNWDISSAVEKLNSENCILYGFFYIDFVHSEMQREIVVQTNTKKTVFKSSLSAELAFKTFIGTIVKVCDLDTTEPIEMSVTTSVLAVVKQSDGMENKIPVGDNDIVCENCKTVTNCYKCTDKLKLIKELKLLLETGDNVMERLAHHIEMRNEDIFAVLDPPNTPDEEFVTMEDRYKQRINRQRFQFRHPQQQGYQQQQQDYQQQHQAYQQLQKPYLQMIPPRAAYSIDPHGIVTPTSIEQNIQKARFQELEKQQMLAKQNLAQENMLIQQKLQQLPQQVYQQHRSSDEQRFPYRQQQVQLAQPPLTMMQQQLPSTYFENLLNVDEWYPQMMPHTMQMAEQEQVMDQSDSNILDDSDSNDFI